MRGLRHDLVAATLALIAAGCDSSHAPSVEELVGTWEMTGWWYTGLSGELADYDGSGKFTFRTDRTFQATLREPHSSGPYTYGGTWRIKGHDVFLSRGMCRAGCRRGIHDGTLRLEEYASSYDFNGDGLPEYAYCTLSLRRI